MPTARMGAVKDDGPVSECGRAVRGMLLREGTGFATAGRTFSLPVRVRNTQMVSAAPRL